MNTLKTMPFRIYKGVNGELIHFNISTLALSEVEPIHVELLDKFIDYEAVDNILAKYPNNDISAYIKDLIDLEMICDAKWHKDKILDIVHEPTPHAYRIALTERCNLACAECFVTKNTTHLATMPENVLFKVINESIENSNGNMLTYHFFGGEPLICFESIVRAVAYINKFVERLIISKPTYAITTNATLLTNEMIEFFLNNDFIVGVSIDGDQKTHDELRPFVDGSGSYSDVSRNYQRMVDAGINCHVLITPNPNHLDDLVNITRYIIDNFSMRTITINTPFKYDTLEWSIPGAQYAKMLFDIMRIAKSKNISVDSAASPAIAAITNETRRMSACSITGDIFMSSVSPSGNLSYCAQKWHECLSIANKPLNKNDEQCKDCESFGICGGICPAFSVLSGLSYDNNKCDFMHAFLPLMAENLDLFEQEEVESDDYSQ